MLRLLFYIEIKFFALLTDFQTCFREFTNSSGHLPYLSEVKDKNRSFQVNDFFFQQNMIMSKKPGNQDFLKLMKIFGMIVEIKACSFQYKDLVIFL